MHRRRGLRTSGQHERRKWQEIGVQRIDFVFEAIDLILRDPQARRRTRLLGYAEIGAEIDRSMQHAQRQEKSSLHRLCHRPRSADRPSAAARRRQATSYPRHRRVYKFC
jgi:hypothetical protein